MAFLWCDSFDHMGTTHAVLLTKYSTSNASTEACSTTFKRTGTHSMRIPTSDWVGRVTTVPAASGDTAIIGFAWYHDSESGFRAMTPAGPLIQIYEGATAHISVTLSDSGLNTGLIQVRRGSSSGTVLGTSTYGLQSDTWYYIELKVKIHDTTGTYEVRVDGSNKVSGTGADTRNGGTGVWNTFYLLNPNLATSTYFDDLYVLDGSGGSMDDFLGPQSVEWLPAQSGNGSNTDFSLSTGSDHGANVDESTPDDDSTYNYSATVNQKDTYNLTDTTLAGTIRGVQSVLRMKKTDASARTVKTVFRSNSTDYDQTEQEVLTTYSYLLEPRATDPDTSAAWDSTGVNALQVGPKVFS